MNKLIIVTYSKEIGDTYRREVENFFGDDLKIDNITSSSDDIAKIKDYDLILLSDFDLIKVCKEYVLDSAKILKVMKDIHPNGIRNLEQVPYNSTAYIVNVGPKTAQESVNLVYNHGRTDLILYPYYPQYNGELKEVDFVITQGEEDFCPDVSAPIINIYDTIIDVQLYWEIILHFNLPEKKYAEKIAAYSTANNSSESFSHVVNKNVVQNNIIKMLFENLDEGIIMIDNDNIITDCSNRSLNWLGKTYEEVINKNIHKVMDIEGNSLKSGQERIITINNHVLIYNVLEGLKAVNNGRRIIILKELETVRRKINKHSKDAIELGNITKYNIKDIVGESKVMKDLKELCLKMAINESSVLIHGESGTGKELFAHVIHSNSMRKDNQFVAINCASVPENLLESEFFGYEEGAFTGAKKGGKKGLFEVANGGTLFLDEIAEIPLHLQNRLLRVLQEREVSRVGGNTIIKVDVRVVAATNVDLKKQVEKGLFRKDLYYRLCVLPLIIPPLRKRQQDVIEIFENLCKRAGANIVLSQEVREFFISYGWDGNIRELRNCFEYLNFLNKPIITMEDLPPNMAAGWVEQDYTPQISNEVATEDKIEQCIMEIIYEENRKNKKIGRKGISDRLLLKNVFKSEQEVRNILLKLAAEGYLIIHKGRAGSQITSKGIERIT